MLQVLQALQVLAPSCSSLPFCALPPQTPLCSRSQVSVFVLFALANQVKLVPVDVAVVVLVELVKTSDVLAKANPPALEMTRGV